MNAHITLHVRFSIFTKVLAGLMILAFLFALVSAYIAAGTLLLLVFAVCAVGDRVSRSIPRRKRVLNVRDQRIRDRIQAMKHL